MQLIFLSSNDLFTVLQVVLYVCHLLENIFVFFVQVVSCASMSSVMPSIVLSDEPLNDVVLGSADDVRPGSRHQSVLPVKVLTTSNATTSTLPHHNIVAEELQQGTSDAIQLVSTLPAAVTSVVLPPINTVLDAVNEGVVSTHKKLALCRSTRTTRTSAEARKHCTYDGCTFSSVHNKDLIRHTRKHTGL